MTVIEELAGLYPQLYLCPGREGEILYADVVYKGRPVKKKSLTHFHTSPMDDICMMETPEGEIRVVTLGNRRDFVTLLRIMGERCRMVPVPETQGAEFLDGVINREVPFIPKKDALIVLSVGPYSGISAEEAGMSAEEWLERSRIIRLYHECTHFVCRRRTPEKADAVRDELIADAIGIFAAFGHYDRRMAERFLGIRDGRYTEGRLKNYTEDPGGMVEMIGGCCARIKAVVEQNREAEPLALAIRLNDEV